MEVSAASSSGWRRPVIALFDKLLRCGDADTGAGRR
jgi:hypothetical protein